MKNFIYGYLLVFCCLPLLAGCGTGDQRPSQNSQSTKSKQFDSEPNHLESEVNRVLVTQKNKVKQHRFVEIKRINNNRYFLRNNFCSNLIAYFPYLKKKFRDPCQRHVYDLLREIGNNKKQSVDGLIEMASDEDMPMKFRLFAINLMGDLEDSDTLKFLLGLSDEEVRATIRSEVIKSIAKRKEYEATVRLQKIAIDSSDPARALAVSFLGKKKDPTTLEILKNILKSEKSNIELKNATLYALRNFNSSDTIFLLKNYVEDLNNPSRIRATALYSLSITAPIEAEGLIKRSLISDNREVRFTAALAASRLKGEDISSMLLKQLIDPANYPHVRKAASTALKQNITKSDLDLIRRHINNLDSYGILLASEILVARKDTHAANVMRRIADSTPDVFLKERLESYAKKLEEMQ